MTHLQKLRTTSILKWVSLNLVETFISVSKTPFWPSGSVYIAQNSRFYGTKRGVENANIENKVRTSPASSDSNYVVKLSSAAWKAAQAALLEYLHLTRNLQFLEAENMSKNSPYFVEKLLKWVEQELDLKEIISRFLRYHPINEFEPFFESMGLKPSEYSPFLPRNLMFLSDDNLLLENYYVLCNYGVERKKIGKMYKEARDIFQYDCGVLSTKLQSYEKLGLSQSIIGKVIVCSPYILIGDVNREFVKVLETLNSIGVKFSLIEEQLMEQNSYNWSKMLRLLSLFSEMGLSEEQLGTLIWQHPGLLLEGSGDGARTLIGLLLKFGSTLDEVRLMFLQFPQIPVGRFFTNLKECFMFFLEIDMQMDEIGKIFRSHSMLLGTCTLKRPNSILCMLNVGKKRLCEYIQENPNNLENLVRGSKVERLPRSRDRERSLMVKTKFLEDVGLIQNPNEAERAVKPFRGRGEELQERFDCIVNAGLDRKDVSEMIRVSPQIINQKKNVIEAKMDFLVHDMGYPISSLLQFPSYLNYTMQRIKLRLSMYNLLTEQGKAEPMLALSTLIACSNNTFMKRYVHKHPKGPQVWQDLKKQIYLEL
ncbi:transcription termination factor MTEF18, mitochondrial-like [Pistacia vera]|uniref:transcription termination factor MTEF18, mitochondrial-like n=1 Tax=Pistacia vera TaxID=55513 RepID=UPI00126300F6|nr:transcription termination factor MTEF18, mitochondrial-like [Pistacia vera]